MKIIKMNKSTFLLFDNRNNFLSMPYDVINHISPSNMKKRRQQQKCFHFKSLFIFVHSAARLVLSLSCPV